jgi:hypothetical protein
MGKWLFVNEHAWLKISIYGLPVERRRKCQQIKAIKQAQNFFPWRERKHFSWGSRRRRVLSLLSLSVEFRRKREILHAFENAKTVLSRRAAGKLLVMPSWEKSKRLTGFYFL